MRKQLVTSYLTKYITFLIILFIAAIFFFLWHAGFLTPIKVRQSEPGPFLLVYSAYQGDYTEGVTIINEIKEWLTANNINSFRGFGIYFDDPRYVLPDQLRAIAGHIIEPPDRLTMTKIKNHFQTAQLDNQSWLQSSFPFRSRLSVLIGIMKVYPKIEEQLTRLKITKTAVMEIYDAEKKKIFYLFPLAIDSKQKLFELYNAKQQ